MDFAKTFYGLFNVASIIQAQQMPTGSDYRLEYSDQICL